MNRSTKNYCPLGTLLTAEREKIGVTVAEFCKVAGISKDTYYKVLSGKTC